MLHRSLLLWPLVMVLMAAGCGDKIQPGTTARDGGPAVTVQIAATRLERTPRYYEAVGTVEARQSATLSAKVMGAIQSVNAREGDVVARDAVLVAIVSRQLDAGFTGARAGLEAAIKARDAAAAAHQAAAAQARLAAATHQRYQSLAVGESVSAQELDEVQSRQDAAAATQARAAADLEAAEQQVLQARAALVAAGADRGDTFVRAPFDGRVSARLVEPGDLAAPGRPLLTLEADEGFRVQMQLPEDHRGAVYAGQPLAVNIPALGPEWFPVPVEEILPTTDAATRSVQVRLGLPPRDDVSAGLFARVRVPVGETVVLRVPETAVVQHGQLTGVFTVNEDLTARFVLVRTGATGDGRIEILSGLQDGQRIVVDPPATLHHGGRVQEAA
ncbi:MAG: efflux RND transporter periplasmic adaptor subunit [Desulfobacteraceae bacterium]|jgi:RND family efflux transporter MFP subunit|nr:efflux RND transporter periplasmic adaptor subunit [Desulfobacteraceae bacterium]